MKKNLILIVSFLALFVFSSCGNNTIGNNTAADGGYNETYEELQSFETTAAETELPQNLSYNEISILTLFDDLLGNALKAKRTYLNERFLIHGEIVGSGSDSYGDYVQVGCTRNDTTYFVTCYFTNESQIDAIMDKNDGDPIAIKGIITDVVENAGYCMNIEDIFTAKKVLIRSLNNGMRDNNEYLYKDVEVSGKIVEISEDNSSVYIMFMYPLDEIDRRVKVKCVLTTEEQIDIIKNASGNMITFQGKVTGQENEDVTVLEVKYIKT